MIDPLLHVRQWAFPKAPEDFFIVEISLGLHSLPILLRGPIFQQSVLCSLQQKINVPLE